MYWCANHFGSCPDLSIHSLFKSLLILRTSHLIISLVSCPRGIILKNAALYLEQRQKLFIIVSN